MDNSNIIKQIKSDIEELEEVIKGNGEKSDSHLAIIIKICEMALRMVEELERTIEGQHYQCSATMLIIYQKILRIRKELNNIEDDFVWVKTNRKDNKKCCCDL